MTSSADNPMITRPPAIHEPSLLRVRPYVLTGGRARGRAEPPRDTPLRTTDEGRRMLVRLTLERRRIVEICQTAIPMAELGARLGLPIQLVRVLVGDLIAEGFVEADTDAPVTTTSDQPDLAVLERVLNGLGNR